MIAASNCDFFSDSYACVYRECHGYTSPYPIVRFGRSTADSAPGGVVPCIALARGSLRTPFEAVIFPMKGWDSSSRGDCVSFLEMIAESRKHIPIRHSGRLSFQRPEFLGNMTLVVQHDIQLNASALWGFWDDDSSLIASVLRDVCCCSVTSPTHHVWCSTTNSLMCFDSSSIFGSSDPMVMHSVPSTPLGIENYDPHSVVAFSERSIFRADRREPSLSLLSMDQQYLNRHEAGGLSGAGCLSGEHYAVCYSRARNLLVFDCRKMSVPVLSRGSPSHLALRGSRHDSKTLLVAGEQVGILDTTSLSVLGAVHLPGGHEAVLDAVVLASSTSSSDHLIKLRVSTVSGRVYDWGVVDDG